VAENADEIITSTPDEGKAYLAQVIPLLLSMMSEIVDSPEWYKTEETGNVDEDDDENYVVADQALDRLAVALGSMSPLLSVLFECLKSMSSSERWEERHAALSAIGGVAQGCAEAMVDEVHGVMGVVENGLRDPHPRVRYSAVYAVAQLCTELEVRFPDRAFIFLHTLI